MKKQTNDPLRIAITLVVLAVASALILGFANRLTKTDDNEIFYNKLKKVYASEVVSELDISNYSNLADTEIIRAVKTADDAIIVISASKKAYSGDGLQLLIIFKDEKIISITPYSQGETPGIGSKVFDKIKGANDAVAVTGATKTSNGVRLAVDNAKRFYESVTEFKKPSDFARGESEWACGEVVE